MRNSLFSLCAQATLALMLTGGGVLSAASTAHVYAAVPGGINVYQVAANGSLTLRQTVPVAKVTALATTPGGRFLYATDGWWVTEYALQPNGTIMQFGAPVAVPPEGVGDLAVHPTTGDYLYAVATTVSAFRTDDADGHLTKSGEVSAATDSYRLAASPFGEYLFALGAERGAAITIKTNLDGTLVGRVGLFALPGLATGAIAADTRFVYVGTVPYTEDGPSSLLVLALQPDGQLAPVSTAGVPANKLVTLRDRYLAASAGGQGSKLEVFAVSAAGQPQKTAEAPIEVFALARGAGAWAANLWVATDDGIVTYGVDTGGRLTRVGKAMVAGATVLAFGAR